MARIKSLGQAIKALFLTAPPTLTTQQESPLLCDSLGNLLVSTAGSTTAGPVILSPPTAKTYRVGFVLVFSSVGGQFLELLGPTSGKSNVTIQLISKPSVAVNWKVVKQSVASTAGTKTTPLPIPLDSTNAAATSILRLYTVAATPGTPVGVTVLDLSIGTGDVFGDTPGNSIAEPITLRLNESLVWSSDVAATIRGMIEWTETA